MNPIRASLLSLIAATSLFAAGGKAYFTDDDLTLGPRSELVKLLGYPAEIEVLDPYLEGGIGASSMWTYYFESRDQKIREIHFMFYGDKQITHETLEQFDVYKPPFRLLRFDDLKDIHKILQSKKSSARRH
jgi:hypothetical protein